MIIRDALKETGKARLSTWHDGAYVYLKNNTIYLKGVGCYDKSYSAKVLIDGDWQPYHEVKEIRAEKAGELWKIKDSVWVTLRRESSPCLKFMHTVTGGEVTLDEWYLKDEIVHNKNGWTRLYPHVEEDVERIEIEGVEWRNHQGIIYATNVVENCHMSHKINLLNKPPMKMILEIPKESK